MLQNIQGKKLKTIKVSNIYKFSIYQVLTFMYKIKRDTALASFRDNSEKYLIVILQDLVKVTS